MANIVDLENKKQELRNELIEKVSAIDIKDWKHSSGSYERGPQSLEEAMAGSMFKGEIVYFDEYCSKHSTYQINLRKDNSDCSLNFFKDGESYSKNYPVLRFSGHDIDKLYQKKDLEFRRYEESCLEEERRKVKMGKLNEDIKLLEKVLKSE